MSDLSSSLDLAGKVDRQAGRIQDLSGQVAELQARLDQLRRGGQEIGKVVRMLSDLIRDAFRRGADDPIAALHMLGDYLAVIPDGGLGVSEHHRIYRALEEHRVKGAELKARVDDLTGQVAGRDETIQRVRDLHSEYRIYTECGHEETEDHNGDPFEIDDIGWICQDGYLYSICRECCIHGGDVQTEECADFHTSAGRPDPDGCWPCRTKAAIDGAPADDGSQK
jgi:hypothetical protein